MSNFKSGSGDLDFGAGDEDDEGNKVAEETTGTRDEQESPDSTSTERPTSASPEKPSSDAESPDERPESNQASGENDEESGTSADAYPYFVRRNNVGDERETRLELHVRDKVADREAEFRSELAETLGASEISKTDAREFALLAAFHRPDRVADLMREEGFGALD